MLIKREELIRSQVDYYKYKIKDGIALLIIFHVAVLIIAIVLAYFVDYLWAIVLETVAVALTSIIFIAENRRINKIVKGKNQVYKSIEINVDYEKLTLECIMENSVESKKSKIEFAAMSKAKQLTIYKRKCNIIVTEKNYKNIKEQLPQDGEIIQTIDIDLVKEKEDINRLISRKKKNNLLYISSENSRKITRERKQTSTPNDGMYLRENSEYKIKFEIGIGEINLVKEYAKFVKIIQKNDGVIILPKNENTLAFYNKLSRCKYGSYKVIK